jgi:hypothetical protein
LANLVGVIAVTGCGLHVPSAGAAWHLVSFSWGSPLRSLSASQSASKWPLHGAR